MNVVLGNTEGELKKYWMNLLIKISHKGYKWEYGIVIEMLNIGD